MCSLVKDFDFDVFCVTETWLQPDTPSDNYHLPGYIMVRCDRNITTQENRAGGGVAIYIKEHIVYEQIMLSERLDPGIEHVCVVLKIKGQKIGICVVYRPPQVRYSCLSPMFHSLFVDLAVQVNTVLCLGDTNIDLLSKTCNEAKYLRRLLKESNAIQLIREATRVSNTSKTLIDHIIVDKSTNIEMNGVIDTSDIRDYRQMKITDHKMVYCAIKCEKEKARPKYITYRDFSKFDHQKAVNETAVINWQSIIDMKNVNVIEQVISSNIRRVYDEQAPIVTKRVTKKRAPWKNAQIKTLSKTKRRLRSKYWNTKKDEDWESYKEIRNRLSGLVWRAKKSLFRRQAHECKEP